MDIILTDELEEREQRIERMMRHAWYETALEYKVIRDRNLYKRNGTGKWSWSTWADYCIERWNRPANKIDEQIARARECAEIVQIGTVSTENLPANMSHATELAKLERIEQRAEVWNRVLSLGVPITARVVETEVTKYKAELARDWITVDEWGDMPEDERLHLVQPRSSDNKFNETNDNIEWAAWSWNPVTGCLHDCSYCYARDLANRFYPQKFEASFYPGRLTAPKNTKPIPPRWEGDTGNRSVFVCSMADLFGKWVPTEWIEAVLKQVKDNPQWTYLFLTKFPIRMAEFEYPENAWLGTTVDKQWAVDRAEKAFRKIKSTGFKGICWLSCEPMLERLTFSSLDMFDWVIIGGASKSTQTPEYHPPFDDIVHLHLQARASGCKIYHKTNLFERLREYPVHSEKRGVHAY